MTTGPYVLVESSEAKKYADQARQLHDSTDFRYKQLRQKAIYYNALEMARLLKLLEGFYANRAINLRHFLIVHLYQ